MVVGSIVTVCWLGAPAAGIAVASSVPIASSATVIAAITLRTGVVMAAREVRIEEFLSTSSGGETTLPRRLPAILDCPARRFNGLSN
jgi:hypothetical protein